MCMSSKRKFEWVGQRGRIDINGHVNFVFGRLIRIVCITEAVDDERYSTCGQHADRLRTGCWVNVFDEIHFIWD